MRYMSVNSEKRFAITVSEYHIIKLQGMGAKSCAPGSRGCLADVKNGLNIETVLVNRVQINWPTQQFTKAQRTTYHYQDNNECVTPDSQ